MASELKVLGSPMDKGEPWEKKGERIISIAQSTDNRGFVPSVCFQICKETGKKKTQRITEGLFLTTADALKIGKELAAEAKRIQREEDKRTGGMEERRLKVVCDFEFIHGLIVVKGSELKYGEDEPATEQINKTSITVSKKIKKGAIASTPYRYFKNRNRYFNQLIEEGKCVEIKVKAKN